MLWTKKSRQEIFLENLLLSSKLIDWEILNKVRSSYLENPYHNYLHALKVASYILYLDTNSVSIIEIKSLLFAALFHDAGQSFKANMLDEFSALDIALTFLRSIETRDMAIGIDVSIVRQAIMGTVFSKRGKIDNRYARILSDCDIGVVGEDIGNYCYYSIPLHLEFEQDFNTFIQSSQRSYLKYLLQINPLIIISEEMRKVLPNSFKTIADFCRMEMRTKNAMYETLKNEDITYEEFRKKFHLT